MGGCVSKQWGSILCRPDFTELFLTRSSARPRLLFAIQLYRENEWLFFSSPQPHSPYDKSSSLVVAADFKLKFPGDMRLDFCSRASTGLFCFCLKLVSKQYVDTVQHVICNPTTGQYGILPNLRMKRESTSFLGFDPIDKQFKVLLCMAQPSCDYRILTLGTGKMGWRKIESPLTHRLDSSQGICIDGFLYYFARESYEKPCVIVCFDVRSEKFKFIDAQSIYGSRCDHMKLINYKAKLAVISWQCHYTYHELCMWVLEDYEIQEGSKYAYTFPDGIFVRPHNVSVFGVTATGEIVLSKDYTSKPFYVFYFNPESNTLRSVKIQGNYEVLDRSYKSVCAFVDHVEDLNFNMKAHQDRLRFESINKVDALCLLDDD